MCDAVSLGDKFPTFRKCYGTCERWEMLHSDTASRTTRFESSGNEIIYDMIDLLTAIGLSPGGSSTVHIYTQTTHRTTQITTEQHK